MALRAEEAVPAEAPVPEESLTPKRQRLLLRLAAQEELADEDDELRPELVERLVVLVWDLHRLWELDRNFHSGHGRFGRHSLFSAESHAAADARQGVIELLLDVKRRRIASCGDSTGPFASLSNSLPALIPRGPRPGRSRSRS